MKRIDKNGFWYVVNHKFHGLYYDHGLCIGYFYKHNRKGFYLEKYL